MKKVFFPLVFIITGASLLFGETYSGQNDIVIENQIISENMKFDDCNGVLLRNVIFENAELWIRHSSNVEVTGCVFKGTSLLFIDYHYYFDPSDTVFIRNNKFLSTGLAAQIMDSWYVKLENNDFGTVTQCPEKFLDLVGINYIKVQNNNFYGEVSRTTVIYLDWGELTFDSNYYSGGISGFVDSNARLSPIGAYIFSGFLPPLNKETTVEFKVKSGKTIPVKFQLLDNDGVPLSEVKSNVHITIAKIAGDGVETPVTVTGDLSAGEANDGTEFRYDDASQQYIYNLTPSLLRELAVYKIGVTVDGTQIVSDTYSVKVK